MQYRLLSQLSALTLATVVVLSACSGDHVGHRVRVVDADDRLPAVTSSDWVTYSDYVVLVSAVSDVEIAPTTEEVEQGEGVILRTVSLRVDDVLWSNPGAAREVPQQFAWTAFGWSFTGGLKNRTEMAGEGEPRIETGHRYLMAIEWQPEGCTPQHRVPAGWRGLGSDSTAPIDGGIVGDGEMEGHEQSAAAVLKTIDPDDPNYSFRDAMTGKSAADVRAALAAARPERAEDYGPDLAPPCS